VNTDHDPARQLFETWFLGIQTVQYWSDFLLWEQFLQMHPDVKYILELGALRGGFSLFLLLESLQRKLKFTTVDQVPAEAIDTPVGKSAGLYQHMLIGNIFVGLKPLITELIKDPDQHPMILFCDDGNKPLEAKTFVPDLSPGDFLFVHDWGSEFTDHDIEPFRSLVEPYWTDRCDSFVSMTRIYRRR